jgi:hypothetical protein
MKTQPILKQKSCLHLVEQSESIGLQIGDRVEVAGLSKHQGEIVAIKNNAYSGLTYSVRVGDLRLDGINPLALKALS